MTPSRPKPLGGALLGMLLGLIVTALLAALGVIAPDRLPLFGFVGIGVILGAVLLTQRIALAKKRFVAAAAVGALLVGVALTGIPEIIRGGSMSPGCMVTGTSSLNQELVSPANTSTVNPFAVSKTDTVHWSTQTSAPATPASGTVALMIGGIHIPIRNLEFKESPDLTTWNGELSVQDELDAMPGAARLFATGTHHVAVDITTGEDHCRGDGYVRIVPRHALDGALLVILWILLAGVLLALIVLAVQVRQSIRQSDRAVAMVGTSAIPGTTSTAPPATAHLVAEEPPAAPTTTPAHSSPATPVQPAGIQTPITSTTATPVPAGGEGTHDAPHSPANTPAPADETTNPGDTPGHDHDRIGPGDTESTPPRASSGA